VFASPPTQAAPTLVASWSTSADRNRETLEALAINGVHHGNAWPACTDCEAVAGEERKRLALLRRAVLAVCDGDITPPEEEGEEEGEKCEEGYQCVSNAPSGSDGDTDGVGDIDGVGKQRSGPRSSSSSSSSHSSSRSRLFNPSLGYDRAALGVEGLVLDRLGRRALLCFGPRPPRPKPGHTSVDR